MRFERFENDLQRRFPQLPRLPRYGYTVVAGLSVFSLLMCMMLCTGLALIAGLPSAATPTPIPPTLLPVEPVSCDDPDAPDILWQLQGTECVLHEEKIDGTATTILDMSYPHTFVSQAPFTKASILNVLRSLRDGFWQERAENPPNPDAPDVPSDSWEFHVSTEVTAFSSDVMSLIFTINAYTGGAHPYSYYETVTFDLPGQRTLSLADIFNPGVDPYAVIAPLARVQLLTQYPDQVDPINNGTEQNADNFRTWGLTSDSLVLYFAQGTVLASAAGNQQVSIPLASIASNLRPEFVPAR